MRNFGIKKMFENIVTGKGFLMFQDRNKYVTIPNLERSIEISDLKKYSGVLDLQELQQILGLMISENQKHGQRV